jgi:hypothetical protein
MLRSVMENAAERGSACEAENRGPYVTSLSKLTFSKKSILLFAVIIKLTNKKCI